VSVVRPRIQRRAGSKLARIERAVLAEIESLRALSDEGQARTNVRFIVYRLISGGVIEKARRDRTGGRRPDQDVSVVLSDLRWSGVVSFEEVKDRTRAILDYTGSRTFLEGAIDALRNVRVDPWDEPAPLLIVESESLAGVLEESAYMYRVPLVPSRGQTSLSLVHEVSLFVRHGHRRVLYVGDFDRSGGEIEQSFRERVERLSGIELDWRRVALTREQVTEHRLPVTDKWDGRHRRHFAAVETEALDQTILIPLIENALAELLPQGALQRVALEEERQREQTIAALREIGESNR
jgi:hypothetical protein